MLSSDAARYEHDALLLSGNFFWLMGAHALHCVALLMQLRLRPETWGRATAGCIGALFLDLLHSTSMFSPVLPRLPHRLLQA